MWRNRDASPLAMRKKSEWLAADGRWWHAMKEPMTTTAHRDRNGKGRRVAVALKDHAWEREGEATVNLGRI